MKILKGNRGFSVSGILYPLFLLFVTLVLLILFNLTQSRVLLNKQKQDLMGKINGDQVAIQIIIPTENVFRENDSIDLENGVKVVGRGSQGAVLTYESNPPFDNTKEGTYIITYKAVSTIGTTSTKTREIVIVKDKYDYAYTGNYQKFVVPTTGYYDFEAWGAQGASSIGKGAYTYGRILLTKGEEIFIYVGQGLNGSSNTSSFNAGAGDNGGTPGGGATDFRLTSGIWNDFNSLKSRIMVAAGSGSGTGNSNINLGSGGALTGISGGGTKGGTQTAPGAKQFATAANSGFGFANGGCAGGNGYYGGGGSSCVNGAGGGSSYISGHQGVDSIAETSTSSNIIHTGNSIHYSNKKFELTSMKAGNEVMPNYNGGSMTGNSGHGYARIKYSGQALFNSGDKYDYAYTGNYQEIIIPVSGHYKLEAWGAQGDHDTYGGKGAYTTGTIKLEKDEKIYIYVGGRGSAKTAGYNGGGTGNTQAAKGAGGGSTDFRLTSGTWNNATSLRSRIMVASGGAGGNSTLGALYAGGVGGTLTGLHNTGNSGNLQGRGGTQIAGGIIGPSYSHPLDATSGSFGAGGTAGYYQSGAGGGGYYGGGGGTHQTPSTSGSGGGGSSFISGHTGCIAIKSETDQTPKVTTYSKIEDSYHYSNKVFTDTQMKAGNEVMPNYNGGTMTGNSGNGYARITYIGN